ncbi:MAG: FIST C-terminal domain-containing protein [Candidatus Omnitrophica bacterium]|jgi:hypothetical protein|nr:FIST C-terminal domain-containing protein [Candidatus Omnitrophota bacterium]
MIDIGTGASSAKNDVAAVEEAVRLAKAKKSIKERISLALVFNSSDVPFAGVLKNISTLLPDVPVIGATVSGFFSATSVYKRGVFVALITFPEGVYFTTGHTNGVSVANSGIAAGEEMAEQLLYGFKNVPRSTSLLLFDNLAKGSTNFISGLQEKLGKSFPCVGAALANPTDSRLNCLYFNEISLTDSCVGLLLGGKVTFGFGLRHGWKPLGKPHTISSAEDNIIRTIDDAPAIELYEEYLGYDEQKIRSEFKNLSMLYPIGIKTAGQEEYLLRSIQSVESDGSIVCLGSVSPGSTIRLMISTKETCLEATRAAINEAKTTLSLQAVKFHKEKTSKLMLVFNSFPRAVCMGKDIQTELKIINESFEPGTGIVGINTFGELAPLAAKSQLGQTYFHNQMISILIIEG